MTRPASVAFDRGDPVYIKQLVNVHPMLVANHVRLVESVGWRLQGEPQQNLAPWPTKGQLRWTLTFRRADQSDT